MNAEDFPRRDNEINSLIRVILIGCSECSMCYFQCTTQQEKVRVNRKAKDRLKELRKSRIEDMIDGVESTTEFPFEAVALALSLWESE